MHWNWRQNESEDFCYCVDTCKVTLTYDFNLFDLSQVNNEIMEKGLVLEVEDLMHSQDDLTALQVANSYLRLIRIYRTAVLCSCFQSPAALGVR